MNENQDMRRALIRVATTSLWAFGGASLTREQAEILLPGWVHADLLDDEARAEVLWHIAGEVRSEPEPVTETDETSAHAVTRYLQPGGRSPRKLFGFECRCGDLFEGPSAPRARAAMDAHLVAVAR